MSATEGTVVLVDGCERSCPGGLSGAGRERGEEEEEENVGGHSINLTAVVV